MRSGTELIKSTASAGDISSWSSTDQTLHTQMDAAGAGRMRLLRRGIGRERRLLRALRREDTTRATPREARDQSGASLLRAGRSRGDRLRVDLLSPEVIPVNALSQTLSPGRERSSATYYRR